MRDASTEIIIKSLRILARDIQSDDGVANLALLEAADCLERIVRERDEAREKAEKSKAYKRVLKETNAQLKRERDKAREKLNTNFEEISNKLVVAMSERAPGAKEENY